MDKDNIEFKIELIEKQIKDREIMASWSKKTNRELCVIGTIVLIMILVLTSSRDKLVAIDVFSISLITTSLYKFLNDARSEKREYEHKLRLLQLDKSYYEFLLKNKEVGGGNDESR